MNKIITTSAEGLAMYMNLAEKLSKAELVPPAYRGKPNNILVAIQWGMEIGLTPMRALQSIAIINGKASIYGDELLGLVKTHPAFRGCVEKVKDNVATCTIKRDVAGEIEITERTFSKEDAVTSKLWGKAGPWLQYPDRMLQMRARGFAIRDAFPDAIKGIITYEELRDYPQEAQGGNIKVAVTPSDAEDLDALADKLEAPVLEDQSSEKLTQELFIPGRESKTFDTEHTWCDEFAQILISVTQVSHWTYETKKEKVDTFIKANSKVLGNLQDQDLKKEMTDKIHKFYEYIEQEEHHAQESLNAMADEMDSRGEPDE
tara:strand:+ start:785 stop:1735 length:951 start_codon:yes stop_codon:yes gene_type:complete